MLVGARLRDGGVAMNHGITSTDAESGETPVLTDLSGLLANIASRQASIGRPVVSDIAPIDDLLLRPKAIARAVTNLLDNAAKYAPDDSTIRLEAWADVDNIVFRVMDEGTRPRKMIGKNRQ